MCFVWRESIHTLTFTQAKTRIVTKHDFNPGSEGAACASMASALPCGPSGVVQAAAEEEEEEATTTRVRLPQDPWEPGPDFQPHVAQPPLVRERWQRVAVPAIGSQVRQHAAAAGRF